MCTSPSLRVAARMEGGVWQPLAQPTQHKQVCQKCRQVPLHGFGTRIVRGEPVAYKTCSYCLAKITKRNNDPKVKARKKKLRPRYKAWQDAFNHRDDVKAARERYQSSDKCKARRKESYENGGRRERQKAWGQTPAGKASAKKRNSTSYKRRKADAALWLQEKLRTKLYKMISGSRKKSATLEKWTSFSNADDFIEHMRLQYTGGMTDDNHAYDGWHIGHRIARAMYDPTVDEDIRRCWSTANLFPQWGDENIKLGTQLPSDAELIDLKSIWPTAWNGEMPTGEKKKCLQNRVCVL